MAEAGAPERPTSDKQWYIVHTYSGFEAKVKESLQQRAEAMGMARGDRGDPHPDRGGRRGPGRQEDALDAQVLPGLRAGQDGRCPTTRGTWCKNTPKVTGFVGTGNKPVPLSEDEVERIVNQITVAAEKPKPKLEFQHRRDGADRGRPVQQLHRARSKRSTRTARR